MIELDDARENAFMLVHFSHRQGPMLSCYHTSQLSRKEHLTENTEVLVTVHQIPDDTVDTLMRCIDGNLNGL